MFTFFISLIMTQSVFSQNYIGMNKNLIIPQLKSSYDCGVIVIDHMEGYKLIKYSNMDETISKIIFLNQDDVCVKFIVMYNDYDQLRFIIKDMNKNFEKSTKDAWIERGSKDFIWQLEKKEKFFAFTVTSSQDQSVCTTGKY